MAAPRKKRVTKKAAVAGLPASAVKAETPSVQPTVQEVTGIIVNFADLEAWVAKPYYREESGKTIKLDAAGRQAKRDACDAVGALRAIYASKQAGVDYKPATMKLIHDIAVRRGWKCIVKNGTAVYTCSVQA